MLTRKELIDQGVDPRLASRHQPYRGVRHNGLWCRDRENWGGHHLKDVCRCAGKCAYDYEHGVA